MRLQSYSPHSGLLYEPPYIVAAHPSECRENHRDNSRDRETHGAPSLFGPGDRIVDEYTKEEFHVDQYLGKGGFAECFAVRSNRCRGQFALKVVEKSKLKDPSYSKMHRRSTCTDRSLIRTSFDFEAASRIGSSFSGDGAVPRTDAAHSDQPE